MDNVSVMYDLSEAFNAVSLRNACILFVLENFDKLNAKPGYNILINFNFFRALFRFWKV